MGRENFWSKPKGAQSSLGSGQFEWVGVQTEQAASGLDAREEFLGMAAVSERAINGQFPRLRSKHFQNFCHHHRAMRAGWGFARGEDFGNRFGVALGLVLFVFLLESAG